MEKGWVGRPGLGVCVWDYCVLKFNECSNQHVTILEHKNIYDNVP